MHEYKTLIFKYEIPDTLTHAYQLSSILRMVDQMCSYLAIYCTSVQSDVAILVTHTVPHKNTITVSWELLDPEGLVASIRVTWRLTTPPLLSVICDVEDTKITSVSSIDCPSKGDGVEQGGELDSNSEYVIYLAAKNSEGNIVVENSSATHRTLPGKYIT